MEQVIHHLQLVCQVRKLLVQPPTLLSSFVFHRKKMLELQVTHHLQLVFLRKKLQEQVLTHHFRLVSQVSFQQKEAS